ncbi:transporter substrate-binding domain-containing protein [Azospirillum sp. ST 5-10]|uniref:transporter substrate-binding domain-containing protein n=1 Tax=unclassified Azospirillum TaxID=2630922 RepID=UPI003F4A558D
MPTAALRAVPAALLALCLPLLALAAGPVPAPSPVIRDIQARGVVRCGVVIAPGFAAHDAAGRPVGFMVDLCRALAAAVLGDADAIDLRRSSKPLEFAALENGDVDVSFAQTSWTMERDSALPLDFGPVVFHDGQGFAGWRGRDGVPAFAGDEATVCVTESSTAQSNLRDHMAATGKRWSVRPYKSLDDALQAFLGRECTVLSTDRALLTTMLQALHEPIDDLVVSPDTIAREPVAPLVASRDRTWLTVVRWTMHALVLAEEKAVESQNAARLRDESGDSEVRRLLSGVPGATRRLGLADDWAFQVIRQVGNYGEIFERNLGARSPFGLPRGPNRLWRQGGLLYALPFQ